ncbi:MAG: excinuclease ABC subunit UvrA, partial [Sciscionella sp.]
DTGALLRILFSRLGQPHIGSPQAFSFNLASVSGAGAVTFERGGRTVKERRSFSFTGGQCPRCEGRGSVTDVDLSQLYDEDKSLNDGAVTIPGYGASSWNMGLYKGSGFVDPDKPIRKYTKKERHDFLHHEPVRMKINGVNMTYEGLILRIQRSMLAKDKESMQPHIRAFVERAVTFAACPDCEGTRLSDEARSCKINGISIADACAMQISDLAGWLAELDEPSVGPLLTSLGHTLDSFVQIGLGYLGLDRPAGTLSGGEAQRVKMVRQLGSSLTDVTYVFDEPTIGLHPHDIARMNELLLALRDKGNTVLVVEHKPEAIAIADHVVDLGPGAGTAGGTVCFEGTVSGLRASGTITGRHLDDRATVKETVRTPTGSLQVRGASTHNLRGVDVDIPLGVLVVVTGVAGSGKSSLIQGSVAGRDGVVSVDQAPIKGSRRSNPATYTGALEPIRKAFAKAGGVTPALFSANSEGACPNCNGAGVVYTDLAMMAGVAITCEVCEGQRFEASVLDYTLGGRTIADVLAMSVAEAEEFFATGAARTPAAHKVLRRMVDVGLGYLTLGQPLTTLSGGEQQRIKLATHMAVTGGAGASASARSNGSGPRASSRSTRVYVLDEPTTGLHLADVEQLLGLLDRLVEDGDSVIVIAHHQAVMAHADWIIDLGPGAGHDGGRIVFEGTPAELVAARSTLTGEHLAAYVGT